MEEFVEVEEEWTPYSHTIKVDGKIIKNEKHPYPFNPIYKKPTDRDILLERRVIKW